MRAALAWTLPALFLAACSSQRDNLDPLVNVTAAPSGAAQAYAFDDLGVARLYVCAARGQTMTLSFRAAGAKADQAHTGQWVQVIKALTTGQSTKLVNLVFRANVTPVWVKAVDAAGHGTEVRYPPVSKAETNPPTSGCP